MLELSPPTVSIAGVTPLLVTVPVPANEPITLELPLRSRTDKAVCVDRAPGGNERYGVGVVQAGQGSQRAASEVHKLPETQAGQLRLASHAQGARDQVWAHKVPKGSRVASHGDGVDDGLRGRVDHRHRVAEAVHHVRVQAVGRHRHPKRKASHGDDADDGLRGCVDHRHRVVGLVRHIRVQAVGRHSPPRQDGFPRSMVLTTSLRGRVDHRHRVVGSGSSRTRAGRRA